MAQKIPLPIVVFRNQFKELFLKYLDVFLATYFLYIFQMCDFPFLVKRGQWNYRMQYPLQKQAPSVFEKD
jgi:hypothetical protein